MQTNKVRETVISSVISASRKRHHPDSRRIGVSEVHVTEIKPAFRSRERVPARDGNCRARVETRRALAERGGDASYTIREKIKFPYVIKIDNRKQRQWQKRSQQTR